jgi:GT2 family glycosyltransferase
MQAGLFDADFYRKTYEDVRKAGAVPIVHFLRAGAREGRMPNPLFDPAFYLRKNPEVAGAGVNPLVHYIDQGAREGTNPHPLFDTAYYLKENPDVAASGMNPLGHYLKHGAGEGRKPNPLFDPLQYLDQNPDVKASGENPLAHFLRSGAAHLAKAREEAGFLRSRPKISVLVPVFNVSAKWLDRMIASVEAQTYSNWELCIVDDCSTNPETLAALKRYVDPNAGRINITFLGRNLGIAGATNAALYQSSGEFIALLDNDDELVPDALFEIACVLNEDPDLDVIYTDEDKVDCNGWLDQPFHKPDWSPEFFRHVMYVGHLLSVRRSLALEVRGLDGRFNGVQDFEFMLRLSERTRRIRHIRKILYHWRRIPGSVAYGIEEKKGIGELQLAAVNAHLKRCGIRAQAELHPKIAHRTTINPLPRSTHPRISILIPTRDQPELLGACLKSIFEKTTYPNFEVVLIDNGTTDRTARELFERYKTTVVPFHEPFNYSRANNLGVAQAGGEYIVLLNNDTEVCTAGWLESLLFYAEAPDVAAVSPLLLYPDHMVQHAGVVLGMRGTADHVMRGFPADSDGYFGTLSSSREVSAVTAACMLLRKETFLEVGGFCESFRTVYQDVDLCLRLRAKGKRIIYTPRAVLYHHESRTRGSRYDTLDRALILDLWGKEIAAGDPYFNGNLATALLAAGS